MTIKEVNTPEDFFDFVRNWGYGKRRKINGYYSRINVKITDSQKEAIHELIRQEYYDSISTFVRSAIENKLEEYQI